MHSMMARSNSRYWLSPSMRADASSLGGHTLIDDLRLSGLGSTSTLRIRLDQQRSQLVDLSSAGDANRERFTLWASSAGIVCVATTSEIAMRPPGVSTRIASRKTALLSGARLITHSR